MRPLLRPFLLGAALLGACTSSTEVLPDQEAVDAAAQFERLANDAHRAGAEPSVVNAYHEIGVALSRNGRVSPVTIVIDGTPLEFLATAQQIEFPAGPACTGVESLCLTLPPLRSVVAWEKSNPRRVVQVSGSASTTTIGDATLAGTAMSVPGISGLMYFDGTSGTFIGTSGTQHIGDPVTSTTPCHTASLPPSPMSAPEFMRCTRAEFTASFDGTVGVPAFPIRGNTASGTHTISMAQQPVRGARVELLATPCFPCEDYPREALPPVNFRAGALQAYLTATATASLVTLELRVTNPRTEPVTLQFSSGQQYDFRVRRLDGTVVWVWSADKLFTAALTSRTLGPGETVTYTATWTPTARGALLADGRLTSTSHFAVGTTSFGVP
ncbi:MAG: BsuPI-related putative proteinase inhibitor [Gemmatimonadales bacterium]